MSNISLYIVRAELNHTEEYIKNAFMRKNIGTIKNITFISKENQRGQKYNGVIVDFDKWFDNNISKSLFENLIKSDVDSIQFYHNINQFWYIALNKQLKCESVNDDDISSVSDVLSYNSDERIKDLEQSLMNMKMNFTLMQNKIQKYEQMFMEYEHKDTNAYLQNMGLHAEIADKEAELKRKDMEIMELKSKNALLSIEKIQCEGLNDKLKKVQNIANYTINELID